jgi:hypothetical protein
MGRFLSKDELCVLFYRLVTETQPYWYGQADGDINDWKKGEASLRQSFSF